MRLFDLINLLDKEIRPELSKLHLAVWNGEDNPLDVFLAGNFEEWQSWQKHRNFGRQFIISLVRMNSDDKWLFVGVYKSHQCTHKKEHNIYYYKTTPIPAIDELIGRLVVSFKRSGRQSYLKAEKWVDRIAVVELKPERLTIEEFPGYSNVLLSQSKLDIIVSQNIESWRVALLNVAGIYLITDIATGKQYVGKATGDCGIWQRWTQYSLNGHGGNKQIQSVLKLKGAEYSQNFQYSILEIADTHASNEDISRRESHWKNILRSREHGYNGN